MGRHYRRYIFRAAWRLDGDVGGWALSGVSGEWLPYDGTRTLLGVSYDAVRRCTFAAYSGAATLLRCQATRPSPVAGDYSMSSSCDYRSDQFSCCNNDIIFLSGTIMHNKTKLL